MKIAATVLAVALTTASVMVVWAAGVGFLHLDPKVQRYMFIALALAAALLWIRVLIHWRRTSGATDELRSERL